MTSGYVAMEDALLIVEGDEEGGWQASERLRDHELEALAATPARPDRLLVGTFDTGLHLRSDDGDTFRRVGADVIQSDAVTSLSVSPRDPDTLWAGTEPSVVYRSTDGGGTWERRPGLTDLASASRWSFPPRPHTHHVRWLEPDPDEADRLYVGIEAGALVRTEDGGETWQDHPDGARRDNHTLATHPDAPGLVYTAAGDGFAVSRDGGDSWSYPQEGLAHRYCWSVVADPGDPETVVLSAASGPRAAHDPGGAESYLYRREGDGPWTRIESDALATGDGALRAVLATTGDPGVVYAATNHGLARSTDAGETWTALEVTWPDRFTDQTPRGLAVVAD